MLDFLLIRNRNNNFFHNKWPKGVYFSKEKQKLVLESIEEYFSRFMGTIEILGGEILPDFPQCYFLEFTGDVGKDALSLRTHLHFAVNCQINNLIGQLENKGFLIFVDEIIKDEFFALSGFVNNRPYIMLNTKYTTEDNRLLLSYELARLMFNWEKAQLDGKETIKFTKAIGKAFLFPKKDVIRELGIKRRAITKDMLIVAAKYGISMITLAERAGICNVISKSVVEDFYTKFLKFGWDNGEPTRIEVEKPLLFEQLVYRAINEDEINIQRGVELLKIPYTQVVDKCCFGEI